MEDSKKPPQNLQFGDSPDYGHASAVHAVLRALAHPHPLLEEVARDLSLPHLLPGPARSSPQDIRDVLEQAIERLTATRPHLAALLRARFCEGKTISELAYELHRSQSGLYVRQREAVNHLAAILRQMDQTAARQPSATLARLRRNLPGPTYVRLFGVEQPLIRLQSFLHDPGGPRLISLEGLGGLGKTALAHAAVSACLEDWTDLAWISAADHEFRLWDAERSAGPFMPDDLIEQICWRLGLQVIAGLPPRARLSALQEHLGSYPCLVVIDGLESCHQPESLIPHLLALSGSTRILLTTRQRLLCLPAGANLALREIPRSASLELLAHEIHLHNLPPAPETLLQQCYEIIGGNPLALKLVAGQMISLPIERVLANLHGARLLPPNGLFHHIYRQSWDILEDSARLVLDSLTYFPPRGATYQELKIATDLPEASLDQALNHLIVHALVDLHAVQPECYSIHRLTYTFLMANQASRSAPASASSA
jgi:hypothetical protein